MTQRLRSVVLTIPILLLALTLQACANVMVWRVAGQAPQGAALDSQLPHGTPLYFTLPQFKAQQEDPRAERRIRPVMIEGIQAGLAERSQSREPIFSLDISDQKSYCLVTIKHHGDLLAIVNGLLTLMTLGVIPYYQESELFEVTYDLYRDGKLSKRYQYSIEAKEFVWIFGGSLAHSKARSWGVEGWTGSLGEAFAETARRFSQEAQNDALL